MGAESQTDAPPTTEEEILGDAATPKKTKNKTTKASSGRKKSPKPTTKPAVKIDHVTFENPLEGVSTAETITSPGMLQKKIEKTKKLMLEAEQAQKKGKESKTYKRYAEKLEQYEKDLENLPETSNAEPENITADENDDGEKALYSVQGTTWSPKSQKPSLSTHLGLTKSPKRNKKSSSRSASGSLSPTRKKKAASSSASAGTTTEELKPTVLERKLRKVKKQMTELEKEFGDEVNEKTAYKRLSKKKHSYDKALKEFELRMKLQALEGTLIIDSSSPGIAGVATKPKKKHKKKKEKKVLTKDDVSSTKESPEAPSTDTPIASNSETEETTKSEPVVEPSETKTTIDDGEMALKTNNKTLGIKKPPMVPRPKTTGRRTRLKSTRRQRSMRVSATRIHELDTEFKPQVFPKDATTKEIIRTQLKRNFIFEKLNASSLDDLLQAFAPSSIYKPGDIIVEQGELKEPICFYIITKGAVEYMTNGERTGGAVVGSSFGERGLLYSSSRKASVRAVEETQLHFVDQYTFRYIMQNQTIFKVVWKQATRKVMAMNRLLGTTETRQQMLPDSSDDDDNVAGIDSVEDTDLSPTKTDDDDSESSIIVGLADSDEDSYGAGEVMGQMSMKKMDLQNSFDNMDIGVEDFDRQAVLGEGQFGEVWKVQPKMDKMKNQQFALKIQAKEDIMRECSPGMTISVAEAIERECQILEQLCHPFICEFVHKFEDDENIYLVMGVIRGVELWSVIHRELGEDEWESGISETDAKFYGVLMADTLRYMHRLKICYRDLKPENVMIDHTGYPVFVDFGFAKHIPNGRTFTFCGTPNYTCPEIIGNQGHGFGADLWALGVVIYEMISGENPFYWDGIPELQLLEDIVHNEPEPLGKEFSEDVKDLVSKLLIKDPEKRLGNTGSKDVIRHKWFEDVDLPAAREKRVKAPFIPTLGSSN